MHRDVIQHLFGMTVLEVHPAPRRHGRKQGQSVLDDWAKRNGIVGQPVAFLLSDGIRGLEATSVIVDELQQSEEKEDD